MRSAAVDGDIEALRSVLDPEVTWADCRGPDAVIATFQTMRQKGLVATALRGEQSQDRIVLTVDATVDDHPLTTYFAVFVDGGAIRHIVDAVDAEAAQTVQPPAVPVAGALRSKFERVAPIFVVSDIDEAAVHYEALGFEVEKYGGDAAYGFARRDGIELHLAGHAETDPLSTTSAAYLWVDDADALHAEWASSGCPGRFAAPEATDYGLNEGAHIDPWGNLIRYGSRIG